MFMVRTKFENYYRVEKARSSFNSFFKNSKACVHSDDQFRCYKSHLWPLCIVYITILDRYVWFLYIYTYHRLCFVVIMYIHTCVTYSSHIRIYSLCPKPVITIIAHIGRDNALICIIYKYMYILIE